jgi:hypothetical protein
MQSASTKNCGVVRDLADLPNDTIILKKWLAKVFGRSERGIERAVGRGDLPPPFRHMGRSAWMVGSIREHLKGLQAQAVAAALAERKRLARYSS